MSSPHELFNPGSMPAPRGFSHAVRAASGRVVAIAGQVAHDAEGRIAAESLAEQFDLAAENVVRALEAAGARPEEIVSLQIFTTDVEGYKASSGEIGDAYRRHFGRHFPAIALLGVNALFDPEAKVELLATAVVPGEGHGREPGAS